MAYEYELLPPIVPDMLPAFGSAQSTVKFYFSIGNQEELIKEHIRTIQVSIQQQSQSNEDANGKINYTFFETQNIFIDTTSSSLPRAGVETLNTNLGDHFIELDSNNFPINKFFRIQLRFSKKNYSSTNSFSALDFSEWSKICLIKKIMQPELQILQPFNDKEIKFDSHKISFVPYRIVGQLNTTGETLKIVNITIVDTDSNKIFLQSEDFIPNTNKSFIYILNKQILQGTNYKLIIRFTTQSGYTKTIIRKFQSISQGPTNNILQISTNPVPDQGVMQIILNYEDEGINHNNYSENFVIRRTSAESQFKEWEDIQVIQFKGSKYIWEDKTIKSGTYYKYGISPLKSQGWRGQFKQSQINACFFDDMYLMGDNKQLRIKFDPTISNFKYNVNENVQTALGSKYPFIRRNGKNYYRSFSIGGLITTYMDTYDTFSSSYLDSLSAEKEEYSAAIPGKTFGNFASKESLYNKGFKDQEESTLPSNKIDIYNKNHDIDQYEDIIYEREFRQAVMNFLYKNSVKLFRSSTEGNMLIKLMNITLTPNTNLGRLLYSFNAEAVQIDECNIQNYDKYNIQNINSYKPIINKSKVTGQVMKTLNTDSNINLLSLIIEKYKKNYNSESENNVYVPSYNDIPAWRKIIERIRTNPSENFAQGLQQISALAIKYLKIEIYSLPGLIDITKNSYIEQDTNQINKQTTVLGYLLQVKYKNSTKASSNIIIKSYFEQKRNKFTNMKFEEAIRENNKQFYTGTYIFNNLEDIEEISILSPPGRRENKLSINLQYILDINNQKFDIIPVEMNIRLHPAQIKGVFNPNTDIIKSIKDNYLRYYFEENKIKSPTNTENNKEEKSFILKNIDRIYRLSLQTPIDAAVEITQANSDNDNNNFHTHILNTGYLNINTSRDNTNSYINKCIFKGLHFSPCYAEIHKNDNNNSPSFDFTPGFIPEEIKNSYYYPRKNEFISVKNPDTQTGYFQVNPEDIQQEYLIQNGVYIISSSKKIQGQIQENNALVTTSDFIYNDNTAIIQIDNQLLAYIYINSHWYLFDLNSYLAECPVEAVVNYVYEGGKVKYQLFQS